MWYDQDGKEPSEIADLLHRDKSTLTRFLVKKEKKGGRGRKIALTEKAVDALEKKMESLVKKADGMYEVTMAMLKKATKTKVAERTIFNAFRARGIYFRPFRKKPELTSDDIKSRNTFAKKYGKKTKAWWRSHIHMHIDVKHFPVYINGAGRRHAAQKGTRGAYRKRGQGLEAPYVKTADTVKYFTGARGVKVLAGVGGGKVLVWKYIDAQKWNGQVAADCYKGVIRSALKKKHPRRSSWTVLEDNDPAGFKSNKGKAAKEEAGLSIFEIPRRSPDLNICDFALWHEVNKRMRKQEAKWGADRREGRMAYLARLRRTAMRLPAPFIDKSIETMKKRCAQIALAKGKHIEEGGGSS